MENINRNSSYPAKAKSKQTCCRSKVPSSLHDTNSNEEKTVMAMMLQFFQQEEEFRKTREAQERAEREKDRKLKQEILNTLVNMQQNSTTSFQNPSSTMNSNMETTCESKTVPPVRKLQTGRKASGSTSSSTRSALPSNENSTIITVNEAQNSEKRKGPEVSPTVDLQESNSLSLEHKIPVSPPTKDKIPVSPPTKDKMYDSRLGYSKQPSVSVPVIKCTVRSLENKQDLKSMYVLIDSSCKYSIKKESVANLSFKQVKSLSVCTSVGRAEVTEITTGSIQTSFLVGVNALQTNLSAHNYSLGDSVHLNLKQYSSGKEQCKRKEQCKHDTSDWNLISVTCRCKRNLRKSEIKLRKRFQSWKSVKLKRWPFNS